MTTRKNRSTTLTLETLEDRVTPTSFVNSSGDLVITGTSRSDLIVVDSLSPSEAGGLGWWGQFRVTEYEMTASGLIRRGETSYDDLLLPSPYSVWGGDVFLYGREGNDTLVNNTRLATWAYGEGGDDVLHGSWNHDVLDGGFGKDTLYGYGGNDILYAGYDFSTNYLYGMDGNDVLYGGFGNDNLYGHNGNDMLYGFFGNDVLEGGSGNDFLYGEFGSDTLFGGDDNDVLDGGDDGALDRLNGGAGKDYFQWDWQVINGSWQNADGFGHDFTPGDDAFYGF